MKKKHARTNTFQNKVWWRHWPKSDRSTTLKGPLFGAWRGHRALFLWNHGGKSMESQSPGFQVPFLRRKQLTLSRQKKILYFFEGWLENIPEVLLTNWFLEDYLHSSCLFLKVYFLRPKCKLKLRDSKSIKACGIAGVLFVFLVFFFTPSRV